MSIAISEGDVEGRDRRLEAESLVRNKVFTAETAFPERESQRSLISVNPLRCRMWERHDRLEEYLSEASCREEIESIGEHGQLVPVIARPLSGDPDFDYELICGARRLFIARLLRVPLLMEVRTISDRDATIYVDSENRHRKDISPYERGRSFAQWLRAGLFENQLDLARQLKISTAQVSRLLKLARLPSVIVGAFETPTSICESWADDMWRVCEDARARERVIAIARDLRRLSQPPGAQTVFQLLTQHVATRSNRHSSQPRRRRDEVGFDVAGNPLFKVKYHQKTVAFVFPSTLVSADQVRTIKSLLSTAVPGRIRASRSRERE